MLKDKKIAVLMGGKSGERDIYIRTEPLEQEVRIKIVKELEEKYGEVELLEADTIGPVIGKELREKTAIMISLTARRMNLIMTKNIFWAWNWLKFFKALK